MYMNAVGPPAGASDGVAEERRRRINVWMNAGCVAFLVIVPVALVVHGASTTYVGGDGSSDCLVSGYPTNVDSCADKP